MIDQKQSGNLQGWIFGKLNFHFFVAGLISSKWNGQEIIEEMTISVFASGVLYSNRLNFGQ